MLPDFGLKNPIAIVWLAKRRGFAAAHAGKPSAYRRDFDLDWRLRLQSRGVASGEKRVGTERKAQPFRDVLWQTRDKSLRSGTVIYRQPHLPYILIQLGDTAEHHANRRVGEAGLKREIVSGKDISRIICAPK